MAIPPFILKKTIEITHEIRHTDQKVYVACHTLAMADRNDLFQEGGGYECVVTVTDRDQKPFPVISKARGAELQHSRFLNPLSQVEFRDSEAEPKPLKVVKRSPWQLQVV